jgi:adenylate cyclase
MAEATPDGYANALRREILRSELQRMRVLAIVLAVLFTLTTFVSIISPSFLKALVPGGIEPWVPLAAIGPFLAYEAMAILLIRWRIARDRDFPRYGRFANALLETSVPSVLIYVLALHMQPEIVFGFWPPLLYFVFIVLSTLRLDFWLSVWTGFVAAAEQLGLVLLLVPIERGATEPDKLFYYHFSRSLILLLVGVVAGLVARSLLRQFGNSVAATAARDHVTNLFGQHVSHAVVDRLLASRAAPPNEMRTVCVLFLDIRGFTAMTRERTAAETVALLNDFFAEMVAIVDRHHGIINKFLGDGFLALFGAPLADEAAAEHALAAGREMLRAVDAWNDARPQWALRVGIGIHMGEAVTGTVGSPQRKEYTVIGDTVNLAARLEQLTKEVGARLLVSNAVRGAAPAAEGATDLGPTPIRGYAEPVHVWKVG